MLFIAKFFVTITLTRVSAQPEFPTPTSEISPHNTYVNRLENRHIRAIWGRFGNEYNNSYFGPKKGGLMVDYLAKRFKFTYIYLKTTEQLWYPVGSQRGLANYLFDGEGDLLVHDILMTPEYNQKMELTLPWITSVINLMIPTPKIIATNADAIIKPFQWLVWLLLGISIFATIFALKLTYRPPPLSNSQHATKSNDHASKNYMRNLYLYVFEVLLSQGGYCKRNNLSIRLVAGAWCVTTFVFVQAYTSILFTYIVTPSFTPLLANSIYDVINKPEINLVVVGGQNLDKAIMSMQDKTGLFKQLRDKLESFPKTRCYSSSECNTLVKTGPNIVVANGYFYSRDFIIDDFKKTGKCDLKLAKEPFWPYQLAWGLTKGSPYTETINIGILEMWQYGFMNLWDDWFRAVPGKCVGNVKQGQKTSKRGKTAPISLRNLTGAFIVLITGYCLALIVFAKERLSHAIQHRKFHPSE